MRDILHSIYYYFNKGLRKLYFLSKKIIRYERITPEHLLVIIGVAVAANTCNQTKEQVIVAKSSADSLYKISKQQLMESKSSSDSSLSLAKQQLKLAIEQMKKQTISDSVGDARTIEALTISKQTMESNQENEYWRAQNEYASRRAYLVVNQVILIDSIEINKSVTAKATIANRSNTPALNVRMYSSILSQSEYDTLTLDHAYSTLQTNNSIFIGVDEYKTVYR